MVTAAGADAEIMTDVADLIHAGSSFSFCYSAAVETTTGVTVAADADANHLLSHLISLQGELSFGGSPFIFVILFLHLHIVTIRIFGFLLKLYNSRKG